ncbi:MAG: exoribonuclease [Acidobacteriota bacterium]|nr:exoribonuclease [Acidobacteriota bacterium]
MHDRDQASLLSDIAHEAMIDRGLLPDFSPEVEQQVAQLDHTPPENDLSIRDLRKLLWCSIDNDDSRDLDQLTVAEDLGGNHVRIMVAIADVDSLVKKGTPIDDHARTNTTSVYTAARIFPMLPLELSTDLTSLNEGVDRLAMVIDMTVGSDGNVSQSDLYRALVHNQAKLAYNSLAAWFEGEGEMPAKIGEVPGLAENLKLQNRVAQQLRELRHENGALDLETIEAKPVFRDGKIVDLKREEKNSAKELIEDFMIAANGSTARFLDKHGFSSIRRVVRSPERWDRIEAIAKELGEVLPPDPDAGALEGFLKRRRKADPTRFPDLSLSIVKAMGAGEYVLERAGENPIGHFGLAVKDYTHSTAPNRRFPDLVTQRLVKAALTNQPAPYNDDELNEIATHCTEAEDAANKVERQVRKSAAACVLANRIGERFDGLVTGASAKGTWVRIFHPPVEGKLVHGHENLDIGDRVRVKLVSVDIEAGFIDFVRTH